MKADQLDCALLSLRVEYLERRIAARDQSSAVAVALGFVVFLQLHRVPWVRDLIVGWPEHEMLSFRALVAISVGVGAAGLVVWERSTRLRRSYDARRQTLMRSLTP